MKETLSPHSKMRKQFHKSSERKKKDIISDLRATINKLLKKIRLLEEENERLMLLKTPKVKTPKKEEVKKPKEDPWIKKREQEEAAKKAKEEWRKDFIARFQNGLKDKK